MDNTRIYRTLTFRMLVVVCAAALTALLVGLGGYFAGMAMVDRFYFSEAAVQKRLGEEITSFRDYVEENQVLSTDVTAVEGWNREHPHTQLTIRGMETSIRSSYHGTELVGNESGLLVTYGMVASNAMEFPVNFSDGCFSVAVWRA